VAVIVRLNFIQKTGGCHYAWRSEEFRCGQVRNSGSVTGHCKADEKSRSVSIIALVFEFIVSNEKRSRIGCKVPFTPWIHWLNRLGIITISFCKIVFSGDDTSDVILQKNIYSFNTQLLNYDSVLPNAKTVAWDIYIELYSELSS
jgi:hypothetical protein